jgi:putative ABC transport system permease protein
MGDRLFRLLLRLLPEEFRAAYAREMETTFRDQRREVAGARPGGLWLRTTADVLRRAPAVHADILRRDTRLAIRTLTARPLALMAALVTLTIGIGANVAMFAVVHAVLFAPLPYRHGDRLVAVRETGVGGSDSGTMGYLTFTDLRTRATSFAYLVAASQSIATLAGGGRDAERVNVMRVSREYFDMVGVAPALGRLFTEAEDKPGAARRVMILGDALWRRRFNADPSIIDRVVDMSGIPFKVVGVLPGHYEDVVADRMYLGAEIWTPLGYDPAAVFACRTCRHLRVFGRLAPGVTAERAAGEANQLIDAVERENPKDYNQAGAAVTPLAEVFLGPVRPVLLALWAGVGVLLLVACGNVAHLLLLRASERSEEIAVRTALGVSRRRLVRQFLTESVLLALAGGAAGLTAAWVAVRLVAAEGPDQIPRLASAALNGNVVLVGVAVTLASGVIFGLLPIRQVLRHAAGGLRRSGVRATDTAAAWRSRAGLITANVALAVLLLVGSGLLVRSLGGLLAVEPGVDTSGVLTFNVFASGERFRPGAAANLPDDVQNRLQIDAAVQFYEEVLSKVRALPGVTDAAAVTTLPLGGGLDQYGFHVQGRATPTTRESQAPNADRFVVTPGYFSALRIRLVRGRLLDERDRQSGENVAVINETAVREIFPGEDPLGRRVSLGPADAPPRTIVGIVNDVRHGGLDAPVFPQVYVPHAQWAWAETAMVVVVRTPHDPAALARPVRDVIRSVDPIQPVTGMRPYAAVVAASIGTRRFAATLLTVFAATTIIMAMVGLYGSLGVMVSQRRRELGVRLALGASAAGVRGLVLRHGLRPVAVGLVAGSVLAAASTSALETMLYRVQPLDPATFVVAALALTACSGLACLIPAVRAARIDPAVTLRE